MSVMVPDWEENNGGVFLNWIFRMFQQGVKIMEPPFQCAWIISLGNIQRGWVPCVYCDNHINMYTVLVDIREWINSVYCWFI